MRCFEQRPGNQSIHFDCNDIHVLSAYLKLISRLVIEILIIPHSVASWLQLPDLLPFWLFSLLKSCHKFCLINFSNITSICSILLQSLSFRSAALRLMSEMIRIPVSSNEVVLIEAAIVRGAVQRKNWSKLERSRAKKAATAGTRLAASLAASQRQTPVGSLEVVHLTSGQVAGQPLWQPQLSFAVRIDIIDLASSQTLIVFFGRFHINQKIMWVVCF